MVVLCYSLRQNCWGSHLIKRHFFRHTHVSSLSGYLWTLLLFLNFSAYQIIVLKVVDGAENLPDDYDSKLTDGDNVSEENLNFYITAEIRNDPLHKKSWEFTVGDDTAQGAFVNKALERGEEYVIFQRAMTRDSDVSKLTQFWFFLSTSSWVCNNDNTFIYVSLGFSIQCSC